MSVIEEIAVEVTKLGAKEATPRFLSQIDRTLRNLKDRAVLTMHFNGDDQPAFDLKVGDTRKVGKVIEADILLMSPTHPKVIPSKLAVVRYED